MPTLGTARKFMLAGRTARNLAVGKPITVSYEVTFNCNADCLHCNWGPHVNEPRLEPPFWAEKHAELQPTVAQISGGEPLLRKDLVDIVRAMHRRDPYAVCVLTTNGQLLTEERYFDLRAAAVDEFSISIDYPDSRHNEYRKLKNNFEHLSELVPKLAAQGNQDIVLACVIQSDNYQDAPRLAELAREWGVRVNFSIYTHLRTGDTSLTIDSNGQLNNLARIVDQLAEMQTAGYPICTSEYSLHRMLDFFRKTAMPDCQAGRRFLIVNPWGKLAPCGLIQGQYDSQEELLECFTKTNRCEQCYTAIRANCEKSPSRMLRDAFRALRTGRRS